jgi:hypothetical protein
MLVHDSYWFTLGATAPVIGLAHIVALQGVWRAQTSAFDLRLRVSVGTPGRRAVDHFDTASTVASFIGMLGALLSTSVLGFALVVLAKQRDYAALRGMMGTLLSLSMAALFAVAVIESYGRSALRDANRMARPPDTS